jgi:hypothetical protein
MLHYVTQINLAIEHRAFADYYRLAVSIFTS